jgi:hypothetical protein
LSKNKNKKKKRNALVVCQSGREYWTTQAEFWQWVRDRVVIKVGDHPLKGVFRLEHEELKVVLSNTVLNLAAPNHLREVMQAKQRTRRWS